MIFSVNTTIDGSPFKISSNEANDIVSKTPPLGPPQALEPSGKINNRKILPFFR